MRGTKCDTAQGGAKGRRLPRRTTSHGVHRCARARALCRRWLGGWAAGVYLRVARRLSRCTSIESRHLAARQLQCLMHGQAAALGRTPTNVPRARSTHQQQRQLEAGSAAMTPHTGMLARRLTSAPQQVISLLSRACYHEPAASGRDMGCMVRGQNEGPAARALTHSGDISTSLPCIAPLCRCPCPWRFVAGAHTANRWQGRI